MKVNASVLVGCVMCVLLVVGIGLMYRMNKDQDQWSPNDIYHNVGGSSTSSVSSSVSSSDGVSVSMGSRSSRRYVAAPTISYAPSASMSSTSPVSSVAYSGGGLYTTSSATYKSFGGGTVSGGGVSVSGGSARSAASQPGIGVAGVSMPYMPSASAYSSAASASYLPATDGILAVVNYYPGIGDIAGGSRGVSGRRTVGESTGSVYDDWLRWFDSVGYQYGTTSNGTDYTFTEAQALAAYNAWKSSRNPNLPVPSYDEWKAWFLGSSSHTGMDGNTYSYLPIGDISSLLVLALLYFIVLCVFRLKNIKMASK